MKTTFYAYLWILLMLISGCAENSNKSGNADINNVDYISGVISIKGMSCMSCVANVKKTLSDLDGVSQVKVSLKNKSATIQYNPNNISLDKIIQSINEIGYPAETIKKTPQ
jgi:copper ion binding protein